MQRTRYRYLVCYTQICAYRESSNNPQGEVNFSASQKRGKFKIIRRQKPSYLLSVLGGVGKYIRRYIFDLETILVDFGGFSFIPTDSR